MGSHKGTGYRSNFQPVVSYPPGLGALDNPAVGYDLCILSSPPALLGLSAHGHPCTGTLSLACLRAGSRGTRGMAPSLGPEGRWTPEASVGGLGEAEGSWRQALQAPLAMPPAPPSGTQSGTISRQ